MSGGGELVDVDWENVVNPEDVCSDVDICWVVVSANDMVSAPDVVNSDVGITEFIQFTEATNVNTDGMNRPEHRQKPYTAYYHNYHTFLNV